MLRCVFGFIHLLLLKLAILTSIARLCLVVSESEFNLVSVTTFVKSLLSGCAATRFSSLLIGLGQQFLDCLKLYIEDFGVNGVIQCGT